MLTTFRLQANSKGAFLIRPTVVAASHVSEYFMWVSYLSFIAHYTGLFISPSGASKLDCATTKKDTTERSISIGRESLKVFFVLGALAYLQVPPLGGSRAQ